MFVSVTHVETGYSVTLLSTHGGIKGEVRFDLATDALEFAEIWRDWVGAPRSQTRDDFWMDATTEVA